MSDFQFVCPFCDTNIECPKEYNGVEIECPVCKNTIVPTPMQAEEKTQDFLEEDVSQKKQTKEKSQDFTKKLAILNNPQKATPVLSLSCIDYVKKIVEYWCLLTLAKRILIISALSIGLIGIFSFFIIKKGCPDNIPIYGKAHDDTLANLVLILDSINYKTNIKESIEYDEYNWNKIGLSYDVFLNAKKYLQCNGKCADHKLKYSVIREAVEICLRMNTLYLNNKQANISLANVKIKKLNVELALATDGQISKERKKQIQEKMDEDIKKFEVERLNANKKMSEAFAENEKALKQKLEHAILIMGDFDAYKKLVDKK